MAKILSRFVTALFGALLFFSCPFPEWNNDITEFVEMGMSGVEFRSVRFSNISHYNCVPSDAYNQVTVDIVNYRSIDLTYSVRASSETLSLLRSAPVMLNEESGITQAVFSFETAPSAEWHDLHFTLHVEAPSINKVFPDKEINVRCDSIPTAAQGVQANFDDNNISYVQFTKPTGPTDTDISYAEIRYRPYDEPEWIFETLDISAAVSPVEFYPLDVSEGIPCVYEIVLIDEIGQRSVYVSAANDGLYQVVYHANASDCEGEVPVDYEYYAEDDDLLLLGPGILVREGWTFAGWANTEDPPYPVIFSPGTTVNMPAGGLNLYAVWEINMYTVTFDYNGAPDYETQMVVLSHGSPVPSPFPFPEWEDHQFLGWFTEAEGGEVWDFSQVITDDLTLYAQWSELTAGQVSLDATVEIGAPGSYSLIFNPEYLEYGVGDSRVIGVPA